MMHVLNIGMEALALFATWRAGVRELRVYLGFLLLYDAGLYFAPALIYREDYWICRSVDFALLFAVCWASGSDDFKVSAVNMWGYLCSLVYLVMLSVVWSGPLTDERLYDLTVVSVILNASMILVASAGRKVKRGLCAGCIAWTIAQALPLAWYPLLSLFPLAIWMICLFGKRDGAQHRLYGEGMGATNDATSQRGKGKAVAGSLADGIEVLPRTV